MTLSCTLFRDRKWRRLPSIALFLLLSWGVSALCGLFPSPADNLTILFQAQLTGDPVPESAARSAARDLIPAIAPTALISLGQAIFNLIPLPPLDGSKILYGLLPDSVYFGIMRYENWLSLILFVVLFSGVLDGPLISIRTVIFDGMNNLCALIL